jgi:hypothetical protein
MKTSQVQWLKPIILLIWEAAIRRISVQGQPWQSLQDPISTNVWTWWWMSAIPATWESTNRSVMVHADLGIQWDPIPKIINTGRVGGVAQVIEWVPSKYKVLNLTSSTVKKKERNEKHCHELRKHNGSVAILSLTSEWEESPKFPQMGKSLHTKHGPGCLNHDLPGCTEQCKKALTTSSGHGWPENSANPNSNTALIFKIEN